MAKKKLIVGITEGTKYAYYERWISAEQKAEIIKLSYGLNNLHDLEKCDGVVLSGGGDINPALYNQPDFLTFCTPGEIDESRDQFEWKVMQFIEEHQTPFLGICRGMQFANVFYGGTLIPDIPAFGKFEHGKFKEGHDREHAIMVDKYSKLYKIVGKDSGKINSAHHQAVDMPGVGLVATAVSGDGIIEAMERKINRDRNYFLLVQWHPERMEDLKSVFSKNIRQSFFEGMREQHNVITP